MLADSEALDSLRVQAAAGPGNALAYHAAYEFGGDVTTLPAGDVWLDAINQTPTQDRHFAVHDQHLIALNRADTAAWAAGSWKAITQTTLTGRADEIGRAAAFRSHAHVERRVEAERKTARGVVELHR